MSYKKFLGAASAALMVVIAVTLALAPAARAASKYKVLHAFHGGDGSDPYGGLILDAAGNLYGTTGGGGADNLGTVFKLAPNADGSWTESVLHSFNRSDGRQPNAALIFDAAGNLYGTTARGGARAGTVFELTPNADGSWTESLLHSFDGSDGEYPSAGLIFDAAGNLYGTTEIGGTGNLGTVFRLTPNADGNWTESVLHSFSIDLGVPLAALIFDGAGNLYGTASSGGPADGGAAFKLSPNQDGSWAYSLLHVFQGDPALAPYSGLVFGSAGTLYGSTAYCSSSSGCAGVIYQITP